MRPCLGTTSASRRRVTFRQTLLVVLASVAGREDFVVFELCHAWGIQTAEAAVHRRLDLRLGLFGLFGVGCHRPKTHTVRSWS
jgi:hypothetical protein